MTDIGGICLEAARAWELWLKAGVPQGDLGFEAIAKLGRAVQTTGMPMEKVLERGREELLAEIAADA